MITNDKVLFSNNYWQESGDNEYKGDLTDTEDEVDSDFDIDEGEEPGSEQEDDGPRRKSRVVTKAYKVLLPDAVTCFER